MANLDSSAPENPPAASSLHSIVNGMQPSPATMTTTATHGVPAGTSHIERNAPAAQDAECQRKQRYYVVCQGQSVRIFDSWPPAQDAYSGVSRGNVQSFESWDDAVAHYTEAFVKDLVDIISKNSTPKRKRRNSATPSSILHVPGLIAGPMSTPGSKANPIYVPLTAPTPYILLPIPPCLCGPNAIIMTLETLRCFQAALAALRCPQGTPTPAPHQPASKDSIVVVSNDESDASGK
ncbi:hypothetical protein NLJ89_g12306 [Agrocybe chaxingu]|uniref:Ribonuclease H1 N-terminal domain-containing protein n=1 Tax=Agrocybe chaxingu TaxID=84603 RepID=A0A9W8JNJ1_9AGAR|nr:hypothetical protein NLJ89_g12306 [Agrocybe chaxingu]